MSKIKVVDISSEMDEAMRFYERMVGHLLNEVNGVSSTAAMTGLLGLVDSFCRSSGLNRHDFANALIRGGNEVDEMKNIA